MTQNETGELKTFDNNFNITNVENVGIENPTDSFQPFGLMSLPNRTSGKLTECNNIQFGTRIITSNINVADQNKDSSNDEYRNGKNCVDNCNSSFAPENLYCQIGCEKLLMVLIFLVSLLSLLLVVSILIPSFGVKNNSSTKSDSTDKTTTADTTKEPNIFSTLVTSKANEDDILPWLINYKEWSGVEQSKKCYKKLPPTDTIKFWFERATCNTFKTCTNMLKQDAFIDIDGCHFDDVIFHFAISEQGLVFECRSTNCEIPPEYKKCNESILFIKLYVGNSKLFLTDEECKNSLDFNKQITGLKNLIEYNRRKGVLLEKPLSIYIQNKYCGKIAYQELNKTFGVSDVYESKVVMCPNINSCIED